MSGRRSNFPLPPESPLMRRLLASAALLALPAIAFAQSAPPPGDDHPLLHEIAGQVSAERLHATIEKLVGFGTRHTASDTKSTTRGIGAARRWVEAEFKADAAACGGCLEVITPSESFTGKRLPQPTEVMDVIA